jgi:sigma-E factor negative regulatory protein RseB
MSARAFFGALTLAIAPSAFAETQPVDWLVKMSDAARNATYQGVVIYRSNEMLDTFRVTHRNQNGNELERVQSLSGEPRDILKQNDKVICLFPKDRRMSANRPTPKGLFPSLSPERLKQIVQLYQFDDLGTARVAGRACHGIAVTPRDQFRYGYEIWADAQTLVPLKVNMIGNDGVTLEQMMFTEVAFPATIPDVAFQMPAAADEGKPTLLASAPPAAMSAMPPQLPVGQSPETVEWVLDHLPPGFKITMRDARELPDNRGMVEHLLISDGLTAISVFTVERPVPNRALNGVSQIGAVHAYGRMIGTFHITVVGEAPPETVKMIGDNLKQAGDSEIGDILKP